jgi:hypothetical protein
MSSFAEPTAQAMAGANSSSAGYLAPAAPRSGTGWVTFSGVLLILVGILNLVDGLWALDVSDSSVITNRTKDQLFYAHSLETWGWIYTIGGAIVILVGIGVLTRNQFARWVGIGAAAASMVVNMMWVFVYPTAALIHVGLATLVVYGLTAYGQRDDPDLELS